MLQALRGLMQNRVGIALFAGFAIALLAAGGLLTLSVADPAEKLRVSVRNGSAREGEAVTVRVQIDDRYLEDRNWSHFEIYAWVGAQGVSPDQDANVSTWVVQGAAVTPRHSSDDEYEAEYTFTAPKRGGYYARAYIVYTDATPLEGDRDADGLPDAQDADVDGDRTPNVDDADDDGDNLLDTDDPTPQGGTTAPPAARAAASPLTLVLVAVAGVLASALIWARVPAAAPAKLALVGLVLGLGAAYATGLFGGIPA